MIVEIICVGTEILMGNIVNTNAAFLAEQCASLGLTMYHQTVVGDNPVRLMDTVNQAFIRSDIILLSGGLGPTQDDLTKETVAEVFGLPLVEDSRSMELLKEHFKRFNRPMTENNLKQAYVPMGSIVLENKNGTAPGIIVEGDTSTAILLPGPPNELIPMFHEQVLPYLRKRSDRCFYSAMIKIAGTGESAAETRILDLINNQVNPTIATYAKTAEVDIRVTGSGQTEGDAKAVTIPVVEEICSRFGKEVFTLEEQEQLEDVIVRLLKEKNETVSTAESCTGGLLTGRLVNATGASAVFNEGYITYSNESKIKNLGVKAATLNRFGAVSPQTAMEMAFGCAKAASSDFGLSVTGIAGPEGGSAEKPVGLVYIGCAYKDQCEVKELKLSGSRQKIREVAASHALRLLRETILNSMEK